MGRDPLERDRNFRQNIERWAVARRQSRGLRRWLGRPLAWIFSIALLFFTRPGRVLLVVLIGFVGFFVLLLGLGIKWTQVYSCSVAEARRSSAVIEELGEPIEAGFFAWSPNYSREGSVTDASFRTTLRGPKGEGTLRVWWYSSPVGSSLRMELHKDGQTHQVYGGAVPCPH